MLCIYDAPPFDASVRELFVHLSRRLPSRARMAVIKTWPNGWATTERFHEEVTLPCILGCGGGHNLAHYLRCDCLWALLLNAVSAPSTNLFDTPAQRACLMDISRWSILNCWYAFQVYHAVKIDHRHAVDSAVASQDFCGGMDVCSGAHCNFCRCLCIDAWQ